MQSSLVVAIVLVATAAISFEIGISSAILEIIAGVALGYFVDDLGTIDWLRILANLGMLGIMFMAGFEIDVDRLRMTWKASVGIGLLSLSLPMAGVFIVAYFWYELPLTTAALLSIALSTTSLALVYHSLKSRGLLERSSGQALMGAASIVDVLSMVALALLLGDVGWGTALFLLVFLPMTFGLPKAGRWIFRRYRGSIVELEMRFILVLLVGMAFMAEHVGGIHPAIIAFIIGIVMSEVMDEHAELEEKLKGVIFSLFGPVFFLHAGTQLDLEVMTPALLGTAAVYFIVACGLKFAGSAALSHRLLGVPGRLTGFLFNYRLTFGIISATVGVKVGILTTELYAIVLMVVLGSAVLPVVFLRDRPSELGR